MNSCIYPTWWNPPRLHTSESHSLSSTSPHSNNNEHGQWWPPDGPRWCKRTPRLEKKSPAQPESDILYDKVSGSFSPAGRHGR